MDHGSTDGSIDGVGKASLIHTPRSAFDDLRRARSISHLVASMLEHYDVVIYSDCDEIIVPDPARYSGLVEFFSSSDNDYYTCVGLNVIHHMFDEPPLDADLPVLEQRQYCQFVSPMCKTLATRVSLTWGGGFHSSSVQPRFDDLYLFHLRPVDLGEALARLRVTRELTWEDPNAGLHQRRPNKDLFDLFQAYASWEKIDDFDAARSYIPNVLENTKPLGRPPLFYVPLDITPARLFRIPQRFVGTF